MNIIATFMWPDREWYGTLSYQFTFNESERGELYDLKNDPYQLRNVCYDPAYRDIKEKYMDIMSDYMKQTEDPAGVWYHRIRAFY